MPDESDKTQWSAPRAWALAVPVIVVVAFVLALLENHAVWNYWIARPSLSEELQSSEVVLGVSLYDTSPSGEMRLVNAIDRTHAVKSAIAPCTPVTNECREGRLLLTLEQAGKIHLETPQIDDAVARGAWRECLETVSAKDHLFPARAERFHATRQSDTWPRGAPAGVAIAFQRDEAEYILVTYRSSEIANDRYLYGEQLCRVSPDGVARVKSVRWFLEVSGLEGVDWRVFWPVNILLLTFGYTAVRCVSLVRRPVPRVICGSVLAIAGCTGILAFFWSAWWEPPWRLVINTWGMLLILPLLVVLLNPRRRRS